MFCIWEFALLNSVIVLFVSFVVASEIIGDFTFRETFVYGRQRC